MSILRLATTADAAQIAAIYAPFVAQTHVSFETDIPRADEMARRLAEADGTFPWLACERDGIVAGYAYASAHRSRPGYRFSVDTSAYVRDGDRGRGVGRALYEALLALLRELRYQSVFAGIALPNDASVALHRATGFVEIARYRNVGYKAGAWRDTVWLERAIGSYESPPPEPLGLRDVPPERLAALLTAHARTLR